MGSLFIWALTFASPSMWAVMGTGHTRPALTVPSLTQIRDILSQLEAPIVSALTERMGLATQSDLYANGGAELLNYIHKHEILSETSGRFNYGKLEYPFTLPLIAPDTTTRIKSFPPGQFHQDTFSGNKNLTDTYLTTLVPYFNSPRSYYFHLDNSTFNKDATLNLDVTLLALLSHRIHIGKIVAEAKYAANATGFTPLIKAQDAASIRTMLTNTTQETGVLAQASKAASAFSNAWIVAGSSTPSDFAEGVQNATLDLFSELIDLTTDIELEYLLQRFD